MIIFEDLLLSSLKKLEAGERIALYLATSVKGRLPSIKASKERNDNNKTIA